MTPCLRRLVRLKRLHYAFYGIKIRFQAVVVIYMGLPVHPVMTCPGVIGGSRRLFEGRFNEHHLYLLALSLVESPRRSRYTHRSFRYLRLGPFSMPRR